MTETIFENSLYLDFDPSPTLCRIYDLYYNPPPGDDDDILASP